MTAFFCWLFGFHHASQHFKKVISVGHDTEGCKNMGKFGSKLLIYPERGFFSKN